MSPSRQHNVTFSPDSFRGKPFPCPLCNRELRLKISCKQKPYCTCLECGIQIFFRGQEGISRLHEMIASEQAVILEFSGPTRAIYLYKRLQHLKRQKQVLERKHGHVFRSSDADQVIKALDGEIERLRNELKDANEGGEKNT